MAKVNLFNTNRKKRRLRIRAKVSGTELVPRLSVFRSNKYIYGQLINDKEGKTLVDVFKEALTMPKGNSKIDNAFKLGKLLAEKSKKKKITKVSFDRNGYKYHGRVKSFADGAREGGLEL